jgi:hypothetical protein
MTLFSVTSSFLMKMVFDPMQKGARECAPLPPKEERLVDLKSCPSAGDPGCSDVVFIQASGWRGDRYGSAVTV